MGWGMCMPNIKSLRHLEVCQYDAKCSENAVFWTFLEFFKRGSYKSDGIDAKFLMDLLEHVYCEHTKC